MATVNHSKLATQIVYFDVEGRENLEEVLRVLQRVLKKREELRPLKIVILTAHGEGPVIAYNELRKYEPKIIAVTFPPSFSVKRVNGDRYFPKISENILKFFKGIEIDVVVPPTLPFDFIDGMEAHNQQVKLVRDTISIFGAGFALCIQAVLRACDMGRIESGERVIAVSGDTAGLFIASTTGKFLNGKGGIAIQEIFCKPRGLNISRPTPPRPMLIEGATKSDMGDEASLGLKKS